ncbi:DNA cytosine methyltransferase [Gemmatimonas sp.]|uniref:DNA cytosine methyltransferase n=1 Tax=Gemmatimonas sp. TaxID=1962908 RepID=UPI0025BEC0CF|nr:DNA cytosine methyltransferase [Gemmatimonas sp.]MCA2991174.1 DNA cytosine methyltransferase [Gemmatimonas sp.]
MTHYYAELFAGAGGLSRGLEAAGFHALAHAEIEPHARAVLRHRWPDTRLDGDVTQVNGADYAGVTLLSGGSPCQDLSVAGKRAGLGGSRSSLFYEQVRIWHESQAPYLLWENVYGALSSNAGKDFAAVLSALVGADVDVPVVGRGKSAKPKWQRAGVASGPAAVAAWRVLDLQHFGPPQRRVRVFVLAARTGGVDPAEVLALREGVCGHPSPREQAREGVTRGVAFGINNDSKAGITEGHVAALRAGQRQKPGVLAFGSQNSPAQGASVSDSVSPALDKSKTPAVLAVAMRGREGGTMPEVSAEVPALRTPGGGSSQPFVVCTTGDITHALTHEGADASEDGTGRGTPIVANTICAREAKGWNPARDVGNGAVQTGRPRRLTPKECERLMGWPDDHTRYGVKEDGTRYELSDTARYRLCGNGVGSPCAAWIASRLSAAIQTQSAPFTPEAGP